MDWNQLQNPIVSRRDHQFKIKFRKQKPDLGNFSFLNRTTNDWNNLPVRGFGESPLQENKLKDIGSKVKGFPSSNQFVKISCNCHRTNYPIVDTQIRTYILLAFCTI